MQLELKNGMIVEVGRFFHVDTNGYQIHDLELFDPKDGDMILDQEVYDEVIDTYDTELIDWYMEMAWERVYSIDW